MNKEKKLTPLMKQYWQAKSQHQDKILFFRMGDFYEMFHKDAEVAAPILNIALTVRNKKSGDDTKMCGMPHHSIAGAVGKLLSAGHKVALCDQVEDPKLAKGLVKREVTRILSPGMVYDPETLNELESNYIASFDKKVVAFHDSSTGEAFYFPITAEQSVEFLFSVLNPVEIVLAEAQRTEYFGQFGMIYHLSTHEITDGFKSQSPHECLNRLNSYVSYMNGGASSSIVFEQKSLKENMSLPPTTLTHLEVFKTNGGEKKGSLFNSINRTKTSSGARLLKKWMSFPLTDVDKINQRLNDVEYWVRNPIELEGVRKVFNRVGDVERALGKLTGSNSGPRTLFNLAKYLENGLEALTLYTAPVLDKKCWDAVFPLIELADSLLVLDPPVNLNKGGAIAKGFDSDLDVLISLSEDGQKLLADLEARERQSTGIANLKIKYNNVFGYFLEVTNAHKSKVPEGRYRRKQTLTNAERYITDELKELEEKILSSKAKRIELEQQLFKNVKNQFLNLRQEILHLVQAWSHKDAICGLAQLALEENYCRPAVLIDSALDLKQSRHPVIEQELESPFMPNDIYMEAGECFLVTGPNMAGKSTIMRQVAICSLLAQMGGYVPAQSATLPIFEHIFTRIGASDSLTQGLSTFMVEMQETSEILHRCGSRSLIVMDEVGRGTSTYDGMSLAQAILEHLLERSESPMCFFATHYHELTALQKKYKALKNVHMAIAEDKGELQFLYSLISGPANKSYGIHVAKLAGLPSALVQRAEGILSSIENQLVEPVQIPLEMDLPLLKFSQESHSNSEPEPVPVVPTHIERLMEEIKDISLSEMTPIAALNKISDWQNRI